ncbi:N-acetyltransferase [Streptomyces albiflavescens]|uniref:N-acetyltransferase n=1 Tax=Streptomyces albiflavescens TaxID=1623582 RepID=A0A918D1Y4_9ACTN|nr:N-acetyltransferase [Streptomyces albiflavescens]
MTTLSRLDALQLRASVGELADLLIDTVHSGASIGFLAPLDRRAAIAWWEGRTAAVSAGRLAVWVARGEGRLLGTVGLVFPDKPNSRHRAELVKLMVHRDGRGQGLGRALLKTAEAEAVAAGVTLLHLDTETDSPAESLYRSAGWTRLGAIPDYAASPSGELHPTTIFYKRVGAEAAPLGA